ncbi:hypothetical protein FKB34_12610 [Glycocaulis profundi]|nr:hypothetical protein FKB34_12610 [Glycocaulis profundi]
MSKARSRPADLLPPDAGRDGPLFAVSAILVFLACLCALGAVGAWTAASGWTAQLSDQITIQVLSEDDRDIAADAADAGERVARLPGVESVEVRPREASERLLEPWLGRGGLPDDFPVPRVIAVRIDPAAPPLTAAVEGVFEEAGYTVLVDDHQRWAGAVAQAAATVRYFALALVALLGLAAAAVVAFAARASLAARWDVADALHLVGAPDGFITSLFQRRFFLLGLKAGLTGAFAAALAAAGLAFAGGAAGALFFLPSLELGWGAAFIPPAAAILSGLVAAIAARSAVSAALARRWS